MKDLVKIQKEIAKEVLEELEVIDPYCILAGGAPRDWFFGKPASDLDFYVYDDRNLSQQVWKERLNKTLLDIEILGLIEGKDTTEVEHEYSAMKHLRYVFEGTHMGMTVQVMVMNEPTFNCVVDHFCMDNSKIWWKGGQIIPTYEFLLATATRTLKVCECHTPHTRYIDKILKKFPTYFITKSDEQYSYRVDRFVDMSEAGSRLGLIKEWLDLTDKVAEDVSIPFYMPITEACFSPSRRCFV